MLNLCNFMDGINGIAGIEAFTVAGGLALIALMLGPYPAVVALGGLIAAGALGFLPWNFPTARIFMGDAGSGLLGLLLGALILLAAHAAPLLFWSGIVLSAIFWIDATVTLLVRTARRERITEAHRSHAYQHAAAKWGHTRVTLLVLLINLVLLLPVAWLLAAGVIPALPTVHAVGGAGQGGRWSTDPRKRDLSLLEPHPEYLIGDPDEIADMDWSCEINHRISSRPVLSIRACVILYTAVMARPKRRLIRRLTSII
jgi:hypothetical protein